jgi:hypothetical protein
VNSREFINLLNIIKAKFMPKKPEVQGGFLLIGILLLFLQSSTLSTEVIVFAWIRMGHFFNSLLLIFRDKPTEM